MTSAVLQVRNGGSLGQGGGRGNEKKWMHSKYNLEIKPTGLDMEDERGVIKKEPHVLTWAAGRW